MRNGYSDPYSHFIIQGPTPINVEAENLTLKDNDINGNSNNGSLAPRLERPAMEDTINILEVGLHEQDQTYLGQQQNEETNNIALTYLPSLPSLPNDQNPESCFNMFDFAAAYGFSSDEDGTSFEPDAVSIYSASGVNLEYLFNPENQSKVIQGNLKDIHPKIWY